MRMVKIAFLMLLVAFPVLGQGSTGHRGCT